MAFDYSPILATKSALLDKFGKTTAIVRVKGAKTSDPVTGTVSYAASTDTPTNAVEVEHNEKFTPGALIEDGDIFYVVDDEVNPEDELVINDLFLNVVQVWPIKPGGTSIAWRVQTRGGIIDSTPGTPGTAPSDAFDYDGIASTASGLIEEFGQAAILLTVTSETSDPVAGTVTAPQVQATDIQVVQTKHNEKYVATALVEDSDRFYYLDSVASPGDEIMIDDEQFNIVRAWPVKPGDTSIVTRVQTRGGFRITLQNVISGEFNVISGSFNVVTGT